ncbi:M23 family metallopeptidase [Calidifontibacillus erzurumensis]|uniref:M23 family metallopeptidase n=1 Tax=Calidifontibacillus erzurumensis TaxID=2741433 RepID=A0A8J8GBG0_9BACI|nr:M23 family metallopeptidase [Calidifontibacillus erzurumensis]NSL50719.1 M23 family metallopeptidase [Calidifontibacillus erzurumensis]
MRQLLLILVLLLCISACKNTNDDQTRAKERDEQFVQIDLSEKWGEIPHKMINNQMYIQVRPFIDFMKGHALFDNVNQTLELKIGENRYFFTLGLPVLEKDGLFLPCPKDVFVIRNNNTWILQQFLIDTVGFTTKMENNRFFVKMPDMAKETMIDEASNQTVLGNVENVIQLLNVLEKPIKGAQVATIPTHLPGAKRTYRHGVHEGIDWYGYASGVPIDRATEVYAMYDGIVIRADHEYEPYKSERERNNDLQLAAKAGFTPAYILDRLRGRQVWIQYENGLQARFAHLDKINEDLQVGDVVNANTLIGYVGNSGTSGEVKGNQSELHLHLDLLYKGELFWKGLTTKEIEEVLQAVFSNKKG